MAKRSKRHHSNAGQSLKMHEPDLATYKPAKRLPAVAEYPYKKFEKVAMLMPFTQKEWASMLHLSERTIQRYAKDNANFEGIYIDRILHLEQMIRMGLDVFVNADAFYTWLKREKSVLGNVVNFESLYTSQGIQDITEELGRMQHGIYI